MTPAYKTFALLIAFGGLQSCAVLNSSIRKQRVMDENISKLTHYKDSVIAKRTMIYSQANPENRCLADVEVERLKLVFGEQDYERVSIHGGDDSLKLDPNTAAATFYNHIFLTKHYMEEYIPKKFGTKPALFIDEGTLFHEYCHTFNLTHGIYSVDDDSVSFKDKYPDEKYDKYAHAEDNGNYLNCNDEQQAVIAETIGTLMLDFLDNEKCASTQNAQEDMTLGYYKKIMKLANYIDGVLPLPGLQKIQQKFEQTSFVNPKNIDEVKKLKVNYQYILDLYNSPEMNRYQQTSFIGPVQPR